MQALEHIHANEVILTVGKSRTIEVFLKVMRLQDYQKSFNRSGYVCMCNSQLLCGPHRE